MNDGEEEQLSKNVNYAYGICGFFLNMRDASFP